MTFEARHLDYAYANGPLVVRDVSLTSRPGSMTAVIGANGSGKSTLIRMLAGLLRPGAGTIALDGIPLNDWQPRLRARQIAYVPQSTATAFPFQALDIVLSGRTPHTLRFRFESAFSTWLHRLAVNTALMDLRVRRDEEAVDSDTLEHAAGGEVPRRLENDGA